MVISIKLRLHTSFQVLRFTSIIKIYQLKSCKKKKNVETSLETKSKSIMIMKMKYICKSVKNMLSQDSTPQLHNLKSQTTFGSCEGRCSLPWFSFVYSSLLFISVLQGLLFSLIVEQMGVTGHLCCCYGFHLGKTGLKEMKGLEDAE